MTVYFGVEPSGKVESPEKVEQTKTEHDTKDLEEIRNKSEHLASVIKNELEKTRGVAGINNVEVNHLLSDIYNAICRANIKINRIIERRKNCNKSV